MKNPITTFKNLNPLKILFICVGIMSILIGLAINNGCEL